MKRKTMFNSIICTLFFGLSVLLYKYVENISIINTWIYTNRNLERPMQLDTLIKNKDNDIPLAHYYLMLAYRDINIDESIQIGEQFINKNKTYSQDERIDRERYLIYILLAEMFFYKKDYENSKNYYWLALLDEPNNVSLRKNYEYTLRLSTLVEEHNNSEKNTIDYVEKKDEKQQQEKLSTIPLELEKIMNRSNEYYLNLQENQATKLNKW